MRVIALTTLPVAVALLIGPLVGAFILLGTELPVLPANLIGMTLSAALMPVVGIAITLLFFDLRVRERSRPRERTPPGSSSSLAVPRARDGDRIGRDRERDRHGRVSVARARAHRRSVSRGSRRRDHPAPAPGHVADLRDDRRPGRTAGVSVASDLLSLASVAAIPLLDGWIGLGVGALAALAVWERRSIRPGSRRARPCSPTPPGPPGSRSSGPTAFTKRPGASRSSSDRVSPAS